QIDAGDAVYHAVMRLRDHRETIALETLDHPDLPERLRAIELLRDDARREPLQLPFVAGARQARVADVVMDVEVLVVDPEQPVPERHRRETLAIPRDQVQARRDVGAD